MHDGGGGHMGGGHMGGGHMGGHMGGNAGGHPVNPAHHHHGSPGTAPVSPGYLANGEQTGHSGLVAAAGQRFTPVFVLVGVAVIIAIVMLVI
jgi:hypothetical protein